jgi:hypothetical protein
MIAAGLKPISRPIDLTLFEEGKLIIAPGTIEALRADMLAWKNFQKLPQDYYKVRLGFIESRRRHDNKMLQRSLHHFVGMTAKNRKFGMVKRFKFFGRLIPYDYW